VASVDERDWAHLDARGGLLPSAALQVEVERCGPPCPPARLSLGLPAAPAGRRARPAAGAAAPDRRARRAAGRRHGAAAGAATSPRPPSASLTS